MTFSNKCGHAIGLGHQNSGQANRSVCRLCFVILSQDYSLDRGRRSLKRDRTKVRYLPLEGDPVVGQRIPRVRSGRFHPVSRRVDQVGRSPGHGREYVPKYVARISRAWGQHACNGSLLATNLRLELVMTSS
jgi:hypothetical protein